LAYGRLRNDLPAAIASLEKAVALDSKDARTLFELDQFHEAAGTDPATRLSRLEKNPAVVAGNDNALAREVWLLVRTGRLEKALEILSSHHFHVWEGGGEIHSLWIEANLALGRQKLGRKDAQGALMSFQRALEYPANLDVGPPSSGAGSPKIFFHLGQAQRALGRAADSAVSLQKSADFPTGLNEQAYYAASALAELGRPDEARARFEDLARWAQDALSSAPAPDFFEKFGERQSARTRLANLHFVYGLGLAGQGRKTDAKAEFAKALTLDPGHLDARRFLGQ
jgi:tetratricopeptide (TPR) repeat protein